VPPAAAYDEVFDAGGRRRLPYHRLQSRLGWDPISPPESVEGRLRDRPLGDDHSLLPVPLVLDEEDQRTLTHGVGQRARALQAFYADAFLGDQSYLGSGTSLTARLLDEILAAVGTSVSYFRSWWKGHDATEIRFVYGPDLVRDSAGRWQVLEDNVGCVGGCADAHYVTDAYAQAVGPALARRRPDLSQAVANWLGTLGLAPDDPGVVALVTDGDSLDEYLPTRFDEDDRRATLLRDLGLNVVDDAELGRACQTARGSSALKAIVNIGVFSPATWELFRDLAFGQRHTPSLNAPGTIVLGHKALLPYVDEMIGFFLDEEPILGSPRTLLLRTDDLPPDVDNWVVKTGIGCRGDGVFVLRWQQPDQLSALEAVVRGSWPDRAAVAQQYVEPSRIATDVRTAASYRVEVRALGYVTGWQQVQVSEQSVAKLVPDEPPGLLNDVFQHASYAPVVLTS
jgi:hypothetical protein